MNWYIGQEIVCVKTHSSRYVVRGRTYTIKGLIESPCKCGDVLIDVGISYDHNILCPRCNYSYPSNGSMAIKERLFAPLDQDISELTEILEQTTKL